MKYFNSVSEIVPWIREAAGGLINLKGDEALAVLEADAQALADVRTLDEWASAGNKADGYRSSVMLPGTPKHPDDPNAARCVLRCYLPSLGDWRAARGGCHHGPTPDAARHAAAEWVRGQARGTPVECTREAE